MLTLALMCIYFYFYCIIVVVVVDKRRRLQQKAAFCDASPRLSDWSEEICCRRHTCASEGGESDCAVNAYRRSSFETRNEKTVCRM